MSKKIIELNAEIIAKYRLKHLKETKKLLDKLKIPFFLEAGTCLGAIREGKFIEGDTDIDLGILAEDIEDVDKFKNEFLKINEDLIVFGKYQLALCKNFDGFRSIIDISFYHKYLDKRISTFNMVLLVFPEYKCEKIKFYDLIVNVPSPPEKYLEMIYNDWKVVKKEKDPEYLPNLPRFPNIKIKQMDVEEIEKHKKLQETWCKHERKFVYNPTCKKHCPYCRRLL